MNILLVSVKLSFSILIIGLQTTEYGNDAL